MCYDATQPSSPSIPVYGPCDPEAHDRLREILSANRLFLLCNPTRPGRPVVGGESTINGATIEYVLVFESMAAAFDEALHHPHGPDLLYMPVTVAEFLHGFRERAPSICAKFLPSGILCSRDVVASLAPTTSDEPDDDGDCDDE